MPRINPYKQRPVIKHKVARPAPQVAPVARTSTSPSTSGGVPVLTENEEKDGFELKFPGKPSDSILKLFRETAFLPGPQKWHWHFKAKFWYAKRNEATREFAQLIISQSSPGIASAAPIVPIPQEEVVKAFVGEISTEHALSAEEAQALSAISSKSPSVVAPAAVETIVEREEREYQQSAVKALLSGRSGVIPARIEHEQFPRAQWALEVQDGSTRLGYEEWVEAKMDLAAEEAVEPPEQEQAIPCNVVPVEFAPPTVEPVKVAVNQSPEPALPDWRNRFSWSKRERGQLPGQRPHLNSPKNEFLD